MMVKYKREGYEVIAFSGKKMKMNYIQSQRVERIKCESNMIFLGFAIYKIKYDRYKSAYSWWEFLEIKFINSISKKINILFINNFILSGIYIKTSININFFYLKFIF